MQAEGQVQSQGIRYRSKVDAWLAAVLLGVCIFGLGGVLDMIWHILFGIEVSVEALLSPTHLMLGLGVVLIVTGPLRSAWLRLPASKNYGWRRLLPVVIFTGLLLSLFAFFTEYAHPQVNTFSANEPQYMANNLPTDLSLMNADGTLQTRLISDGLNHWDPSWSHDGKKIAFAAGPNTGRNAATQIYVANADGSNQVRLTHDTFDDWGPAWSPDDSKIAFVSNRDGAYKLYVMNANGSNVTRLTNGPGLKASWSPDGSKIVFVSQQDGVSQIYVMNADGNNLTRLTHTSGDEMAPTWSPDGSKIAFVSRRDG